jgi:hypothetical protein
VTYRFEGVADGLIHGTRHGGGRWFVRRRGSETYLLREGGVFQVLRVDEKNRRLDPHFCRRRKRWTRLEHGIGGLTDS